MNEVKVYIENALADKKNDLEEKALASRLDNEFIDITLPGKNRKAEHCILLQKLPLKFRRFLLPSDFRWRKGRKSILRNTILTI